MSEYNKDSIKALSAIDHLRLRPTMYIGSVGLSGIHHLFNEVVDNVIDEHIAGHCNEMNVLVTTSKSGDSISVRDHGRGLPTGYRDDLGMDVIEAIFTKINTSGKFSTDNYLNSSGQNGVGVTVVCALSSKLTVTVYKNKLAKIFEFSKGIPLSSKEEKTDSINGSIVNFTPDKEIFETTTYDLDAIRNKLFSISSILSKLKITLQIINTDLNTIENVTYYNPKMSPLQAIHDKSVKESCELLSPVFTFSKHLNNFNIYLNYFTTHKSTILSYCNTINTSDNGSHIDAVYDSLINIFKKITGRAFSKSQLSQGLFVSLSIFHQFPKFSGQNKAKVADSSVREFVYHTIYDDLYKSISNDKEFVKYFIDLITQQERVFEELEISKAIDVVKSAGKDHKLPAKLTIAYGCSPEERELILVEGNSASGSVKQSRNPKFQEVLALKGKTINGFKSSYADLLANKEVMDIFLSLGAMEKSGTNLRCKSLFILTDADCLHGDTEVWTLKNGLVKISDLYTKFKDGESFYVWSRDEVGNLIPGLAHSPVIKSYKNKYLEITLDNDKKILCTHDHRILLKDNSYKEAKDLLLGESLMPFNYINHEEEPIIIDEVGKKHLEYHLSYERFNSCKRLKFKQVHHKDVNHRNNEPINLEELTFAEHCRFHIIHYNKSEKHKTTVKLMHKLKKFKTWTESYNGSPSHLEAIKRARLKYGKSHFTKGLIFYNKSEKHKNQVILMNSNPDIKYKQSMGKFGRVWITLNKLNLPWNIENFSRYTTEKFDKFSYEEIKSYSLKYLKHLIDSDFLSTERKIDYRAGLDKRNLKWLSNTVKRLKLEGTELTPDSFNKLKPKHMPTLEFYYKTLNLDFTRLIEYALNYNHSVKSIKEIILDTKIPFYDITVDEYHNFALGSGAFVHNCDGKHILTLIISALAIGFPSFIKNHNVYLIESPLFTLFHGKNYQQRIPGHNKESIIKIWREKFPKEKDYKIYRNKGIGEISPHEMVEIIHPDTRVITKLEFTDESINKLNSLLGIVGDVRRSIIENLKDDEDVVES